MSKKARIFSAFAISALCYFYFTISSELYLSSDNVMVAIVTNGLFNTNPFCQYLHPLLCLLIRGVAMLVPSADAFTVLKDAFIFGELVLVFYMLVVAVLLYYSAGQVIAHAKLHAPITAWTSRIGEDESKYEDTFDGIYIWPSWHGAVPRQFAVQNKLPTKRVVEHIIAAGDWTYGQPVL